MLQDLYEVPSACPGTGLGLRRVYRFELRGSGGFKAERLCVLRSVRASLGRKQNYLWKFGGNKPTLEPFLNSLKPQNTKHTPAKKTVAGPS